MVTSLNATNWSPARIPARAPGELGAYCEERLAAYKVPKSVEFVHAIPRTEATKVSRAALIDARGG